eukprot:SAG11_NODE_825_length_6992_cov_2.298564_5_plen_109_part_00
MRRPVVQTFYGDTTVASSFRLDSVVAVVDAKHLVLHLEQTEEVEDKRRRQLAQRIALLEAQLGAVAQDGEEAAEAEAARLRADLAAARAEGNAAADPVCDTRCVTHGV